MPLSVGDLRSYRSFLATRGESAGEGLYAWSGFRGDGMELSNLSLYALSCSTERVLCCAPMECAHAATAMRQIFPDDSYTGVDLKLVLACTA